ncbi:MAG: hypothetical protein KO206_03710 [Methanomicrobiaceae archaeon]|nr:hypothetical protein [Methanomicrobiaceae archaeon]
MKIRWLESMAGFFPCLVMFVYIAGVAFCFAIGEMSYLINGSIIAFPAIVASAVFIVMKRRDTDLTGKTAIFSRNPLVYAALFAIFFMFTILVLRFTPTDSVWGSLALLSLHAIILVQVISRRPLPAAVLGQILLTLAVTIYSYTLRTALYFGNTDTMPHIYLSTVTYLSGHVIPRELGNYAHFPLYHVYIAISSHILGLDIQTSLFIVTCLVFSATVLFLYYLSNSIFKNEQISLLIALVYAMNGSVIHYGTYMVTRTLTYVGFLLLLYVLVSLAEPAYAASRPAARRILVVITFVFILLTHQISTPMIIILLGLLMFLERIVRDRRHVTPVFLAVPVTLFAFYWTFFAYSFIWELFPRADPALYSNVVVSDVLNVGLSFLTNQLDALIVVFFGLIGGIYLIWKQQPRYSIVFGILGLASLALNVPNVLTMVFQLMTVLRIDRFALLLLPFLAVVMGAGMYLLTRYLSALHVPKRLIGILLIALVILYGIGSLGLYREEPAHIRESFNEKEIIGFNHVLRTVPDGSSLHSDYYTARFFGRGKFDGSERLGLPFFNPDDSLQRVMPDNTSAPMNEGYIILLNYQLRHHGLLFSMGQDEFDPGFMQPYPPTEENVGNLLERVSAEDKIYSNHGVDVYHSLP